MKPKIMIVGSSPSASLFRSTCENFVCMDETLPLPSLAQKRTTEYSNARVEIGGAVFEAAATLKLWAEDLPADYFEGLTCERVPTITGTIKPGGDGTRQLFKMLRAWQPPKKKRNKRLHKKLFGGK